MGCYKKQNDFENIIDFLINHFSNIFIEELENNIENVGEKIAISIQEYFKDENNRKLLEKLKNIGLDIYFEKIEKNKNIEGKTFVFTGTLLSIERDKAKDLIKKMGGNVSEGVSKYTDYVIVGENPGSKMNKAKELNVKIIEEDEFNKMINT